jgi:hypothetical protein
MHRPISEVNTLSQKKLKEGLEDFQDRIHQLIRKDNVSKSCVFNADQAGLCYQRFPQTTIWIQHRKNKIKGNKGMKDKDCITFILCTSATGSKVPMAFVGKSKNPRCFKMKKTHVRHYTNNPKAWLNIGVTKRWFHSTFCPSFNTNYCHNCSDNDDSSDDECKVSRIRSPLGPKQNKL